MASGTGNCIITSDTGPTYARQFISSDKPRADTIELDLSQSLTDIQTGIQGLDSNPQVGMDVISSCTNSWMNSIRTRQTMQNLCKTVMSLSISI